MANGIPQPGYGQAMAMKAVGDTLRKGPPARISRTAEWCVKRIPVLS